MCSTKRDTNRQAATQLGDEKFKSLFNGINFPVFVHKFQEEGFSNFIEVNDVACIRYGYNREEFLQLSPKDISSVKDFQERGAAKSRSSLVEEGHVIFTAVHVTKDGKSFPVEVSSNIYYWLGEKVILSVVIDLSERRKTEKKLAEANEIINRSPSVVFLWKNEEGWPVDYVSENVQDVFGYSAKEFVTGVVSYSEVVHKKDLARVYDEVLTVSGNKEIESFTHEPYRITTNSGEVKWIADSTYIRRNPAGEITHYEGIVSCITDRIQVEEALVESENRHRSISELTSDYAFGFRVEPDGSLKNEWVTGALQRVTGYTKEELEELGGWSHLIYPEDLWLPMEQYEQLLLNRASTVEYRIVAKDGTVRWMRDHSRPLWGDDENRVVRIEGAVQDISEQKVTETSLRESEEKYRQLIENSIDAIYLLNDDKLEVINAKFSDIFGVTQKQVLEPDFDYRELIAPESIEFVENSIIDLKQNKSTQSKYEFYMLDRSGNKLLVETYASLIKYNNGEAIQGILRDITQQRKLEQQLQHSQKMEAVGKLAGGIAHDFNNLLTVINGYSELALLKLESSHPIYKTIELILQAGKKAVDLTSQLLAFSRKQIYKADIIEINSVILEMDKLLRRVIGEDINIDTVLGENLSKIKADKSQLEQIFVNLVVNARDAVHAIHRHGYRPRITIETGEVLLGGKYIEEQGEKKEGAHIYISVSDNGIGMDEETKLKIFEPFFSTKGLSKGTGLGLATVYGIVKQNMGSIYVYSEVDQGTTLKIYWPVTNEDSKAKEDKTIEYFDYTGRESILFVEDDDEVASFAYESLTGLGYNVLGASNGMVALDLFETRKDHIDIIVTDLIMPELNGKEFINKVKQISPDIKVIYVSGYTDNHIVHDGMLEPGVNFIQKPYTIETMSRMIREILDKQ